MADASADAPGKPAFEGIKSAGDADRGTFVGLTYDKLDITSAIDRVRSPKAGAVVVFIGTTRDNFEGKPITTLEYTTYAPLALRSLSSIVANLKSGNEPVLHAITIVHRLGVVPIGEDSIVIALSTSHRAEGWRIAEESLELVKEKVEIWKREWFVDGGIWRANRDGARGVNVEGEAVEQADR
ncbi:molybdopterin synthase catalytic subunit [Drechslerella stenobrocha 248]|uniref:Molybdopterin synthase catalytic subunit n=1 Tax=Drechslerella stenobrocha 248 TaxID=1043628 RepID=W7HZW9_9PEZI|nr:molybdopterin synthase catalytic subunit [Drechslerella stenobrocha 248]